MADASVKNICRAARVYLNKDSSFENFAYRTWRHLLYNITLLLNQKSDFTS